MRGYCHEIRLDFVCCIYLVRKNTCGEEIEYMIRIIKMTL